ncbi:MAG: hypothetical protein LKK00_00495 [Intestinimonas sp.]|jgi:ribosomal protein S27E|nr:hypothetical protein [Intestinimonas sp.]
MTISEKVAYLKGLADGLNIDTEKSKEGKLITSIIDVLQDMSMSIEDLEDTTGTLGEAVDAVSDDLSDVEEFLFGDEDDAENEGDEDDDDDSDFFEVECPNCQEELVIDEDVLDAGFIECPNCHQKFSLEMSDEDSECNCGSDCGCGHSTDDDQE